jgi:hypothetical protein
MLIDLKAASYKRNEDQEKAAPLELKELIDSKDFKVIICLLIGHHADQIEM